MMHRWRSLAMDGVLALMFLCAWLLAGVALIHGRGDTLPRATQIGRLSVSERRARDTLSTVEFERLLSTNPFVPGHHSSGGRSHASPTVGDNGEPVVSAKLLLRLMGTTVMPNNRSFVVISVTGEAPATFRVGEEVKGWTIVGIERGRVRLQRAGETEELELTRGS